jgi:Ca2+/Na+ antiporter
MDSLKSGALTVANDQLKLIKNPFIYIQLIFILATIIDIVYQRRMGNKSKYYDLNQLLLGAVILLNLSVYFRNLRAWFEQLVVFGLLYNLYMIKNTS